MKSRNIATEVHGLEMDAHTRCAHYHSALDIVAIKMFCCNAYYACKDCHETLANHSIKVWPIALWGERAILCGNCGEQLSISTYMESGDACPACRALFNPGCRNHYHFYFEHFR